MHKPTKRACGLKLALPPRLVRFKAWLVALSPYLWATLTLQRPVQNWRVRRSTLCSGIDEDFALELNGHPQWLRIRGTSPNNPVVLYLHGGPGGSQIPSYRHYQLAWERHFTLVHWEQRGSGRSSAKVDPATMTLEQLVEDTLKLLDYLANRFQRDDIVLLGHSWGSCLGIHTLLRQPKQVAAYVGLGQVVDQPRAEQRMYEFAVSAAAANGNALASAQLERLRGYPLTRCRPADVAQVRRWAREFGYLGSTPEDTARTYERLMQTPEYSLLGIYHFLQGTWLSSATLGRRMLGDESMQPLALANEFVVPMFFVSGRRDHFTPADLVEEYCERVQAPTKQHVVFDDCGHYANEDNPERFIATIARLVRPYLKH